VREQVQDRLRIGDRRNQIRGALLRIRFTPETILGGDIKNSEIQHIVPRACQAGSVQYLFVERGKSERRRRVKITSERDTK
jgi:hypothetical protein